MTWREALGLAERQRTLSFDVPPPKIATGPVSMRLEVRPAVRLRISRLTWVSNLPEPWLWRVLTRQGHWMETGRAATHAEALAVGLAALEAATVAHA